MKFRFPLEQLLDVRLREKDLAQRDFLFANKDLAEAEALLQSYYDTIAQARQTAGMLRVSGGLCAENLQQTDLFIAGQEVRISRQKEKIRELASIAEQKHAILIEAAKEHKKVEKLRERRMDRFRREQKRRELKEVDDLVTMRFERERK